MSRIGRKNIKIDSAVTFTVNGSDLVVKGPKGTLQATLRDEILMSNSGTELSFEIKPEFEKTKNATAYLGLTRATVNNMITGVTAGFTKDLELVGVGYRAKLTNPHLVTLTLGYSHPIEFPIPEGIQIEVPDVQKITIKGTDRYLVGQVAANLRKLRKPEPYKGKGIKYSTEVVRRKQGKSGKV